MTAASFGTRRCSQGWVRERVRQRRRARRLQRSSVRLIGVDGGAVTHIALQAGHSYRCFSSSRSASFTRRKTSSGRSIPASLTASREADRNSSASEFPMGQNRASWSKVIGSLRFTPIPSAFAGDSAYLPKHVGGLSTEDIMSRRKALTIPRR